MSYSPDAIVQKAPIVRRVANRLIPDNLIHPTATTAQSPVAMIPALSAIAFAFGCAAYLAIRHEPTLLSWLGLGSFTLLLLIGVQKGQLSGLVASSIAFSAIAFSAGFSYTALASANTNTKTLSEPIDRVVVEGWITDILPREGRGVRLELQTQAISGLPSTETPDRVRLTQLSELTVGPGRYVRCYAGLRPPPEPVLERDFNFAQLAWFENLGAVGFVYGSCRPGILEPRSLRQSAALEIAALRRSVAERTVAYAGPAGGVAAALLSGDRSFIDDDQAQALRDTGLAHLLAISGLHMGLAAAIVFFGVMRSLALIEPLALRIPVQKCAAVAAIVAITAYLILTGASVSAQRAYVMALVALTAVVFDRPAISMRSLILAMFIVLLLSPHSVMSPGFQMSFAATASLIAAYEVWQSSPQRAQRSFGIRNAIGSLTLTSAVAGTATAPFAIYHFERIATLGFFANLVAMPIFTFVSAPLAGLVAVSFLFGLEQFTLPIFGWTLSLILQIASNIASSSEAVVRPETQMPSLSLLFFTIAICVVVIGRLRGLLAAVTASIVSMVIWTMDATDRIYILPNGELVTRFSDGEKLFAFDRVDGLRPLQFAHLHSNVCRRQTCTYNLDAGLLLKLDNRFHRACLIREDSPETCFRNPKTDKRALRIDPSSQIVGSELVRLPTGRPWMGVD